MPLRISFTASFCSSLKSYSSVNFPSGISFDIASWGSSASEDSLTRVISPFFSSELIWAEEHEIDAISSFFVHLPRSKRYSRMLMWAADLNFSLCRTSSAFSLETSSANSSTGFLWFTTQEGTISSTTSPLVQLNLSLTFSISSSWSGFNTGVLDNSESISLIYLASPLNSSMTSTTTAVFLESPLPNGTETREPA